MQCHSLPMLLLRDGVFAQSALQVLLQFAGRRVPHAGLEFTKRIALNVHAVERVEQADPRVDVAQIIVANFQRLQLVQGADRVWKQLQFVAVQVQDSQIWGSVHVFDALELVEAEDEAIELFGLGNRGVGAAEAVLVKVEHLELVQLHEGVVFHLSNLVLCY